MRRMAFWSGLVLGGSVSAWLLGSAICYLFTGKLPSIQVSQDQRPRLSLVDIDRLYEAPVVVSVRSRESEREAD
jgi:hypothetical protein